MIKRKYLYILTIFIIIVIVFKIQTIVSSKEKPELIIKETVVPEKPSAVKEIEEVITKYDSIISSEIEEAGTVGAALVVTYKNEIAYIKCFGVQKKGENTPINEHTVFRLASVSKSVTGVLAGILDDEGTIDLEDNVAQYLPELKLKTNANTSNIKVAHLLSHTSGLIPHAYDNMVEDHVPLTRIMQRLQEVDITAEPGRLYGYQNVMFSLYDTIAAVKTSKTYSNLVKEKVFNPFGMYDASTSFEDFEKNPNKAYPHYGSKGRFKSMRLNNRYYSTGPAAGVNASISDMSQFLLNILNDDSQVVTNNVRNTIFTPQVKSPLNRNYLRRWDKVDSKHYSIGWRIIGYKDRQVAYHGGYVLGYKAEIAICEEEEIGIAYLSNSPNGVDSKPVPTFLNLLFELKDKEEIPNS